MVYQHIVLIVGSSWSISQSVFIDPGRDFQTGTRELRRAPHSVILEIEEMKRMREGERNQSLSERPPPPPWMERGQLGGG
jgi:hypothetical protein